jgi:hypothetical protein
MDASMVVSDAARRNLLAQKDTLWAFRTKEHRDP